MFRAEIGDNIMLTCIEHAPSSRYLSENPGHPHKVVNRLRVKKRSSSLVAERLTSSSSFSPSSSSDSSYLPPCAFKVQIVAPPPLWDIDEVEGREQRHIINHNLQQQQQQQQQQQSQQQQSQQQQNHKRQRQRQQQQGGLQRKLSVPGVATIPDPRPWLWCKALSGGGEEAMKEGGEEDEEEHEEEGQQEERGRIQGDSEEEEEEDKMVTPLWETIERTPLSSPFSLPSSSSSSSASSKTSQGPPPLSSSFVWTEANEEKKHEMLRGQGMSGSNRGGAHGGKNGSSAYVNAESMMPSLGVAVEHEEEVPIFDQGTLDAMFK